MCTRAIQFAQSVTWKLILDGKVILNFEVLNFDASCVRTACNFKLGPPTTQSYRTNHEILLRFKTLSKLKVTKPQVCSHCRPLLQVKL